MSNNKLLVSHGERLGIRDPAIIQKAETFQRVLNTKPPKALSDIAKITFCLDLAASNLGAPFDKETALKLTGLRKTAYQNNLNNVEKILNLDKPISVAELCVQLSCTEAQQMALTILDKYQEKDSKIKDIMHPQYAAAAVFASCTLKGIKVDKTQLRLTSRLKLKQWNELTAELSKFAADLGLNVKASLKKDKVDDVVLDGAEGASVKPKIKDKEETIEDYEQWKKRILEEASAEILAREMQN